MCVVNIYKLYLCWCCAEGISLKCVDFHIMEPFWNYIRIDQVFGRAIHEITH